MLTAEERAGLIAVFEERRRCRTDDNGILDAFARIVAAREAEAEQRGAANALREAAANLPGFHAIRTHGDAARWLRARARRALKETA